MRVIFGLLLAVAMSGCNTSAGQRPRAQLDATTPRHQLMANQITSSARTGPVVDHHQHLLSPALSQLFSGSEGEVTLPPQISALLSERTAAWNDPKKLGPLYAKNAILLEDEQVIGRAAISEHVGTRFGRPYAITPIAYSENGESRQLAAFYTRGSGAERINVGSTLMTFAKGPGGRWLITSETMKFPGPSTSSPIDADRLVKMLDEASIDRAVVLSIAYLFDSPLRPEVKDKLARVRAENDWTAAQVRKYPKRLIGFCSVNPLSDFAASEIERCSRDLGLKGLKLHFANSRVDVSKADHLAKVQSIFALANRLNMPIVAHLWTGESYGKREAEVFLSSIRPHAPNITVQIAHMAGAGPGWTDAALEVFANAQEARDPRMHNLYFDLATAADLQKHEALELLARRIRQIGPERVLYGSDAAFGGNRPPNEEWGTFRGMVPLTDAEFAVIRDNVAPYLR